MAIRGTRQRARLTPLRSGFSLIEILIVVSIIGILATLTAPRLNDLRDRNELRNATNRFTRAIMQARQAAIQRGKPAYFKHSGNSIWVYVDTTAAGTDSVVIASAFNLYTNHNTTVTAPAGVVAIQYDPRGVATQPTQQVFRFQHLRGRQDSLCVSRLGNTIRKACPAPPASGT